MSPTERQQQERTDAAFGEWVRERLTAQKPDKWTQQRLRDELAQRGHEVKREWVNQVINGKHASDDLRRAVEGLLGMFPEPDLGEPVSADLASAIRDQTKAISDLVELIRPLVDDSTESILVRLQVLEARATRPSRRAGAASQGRSAPRVTAG